MIGRFPSGFMGRSLLTDFAVNRYVGLRYRNLYLYVADGEAGWKTRANPSMQYRRPVGFGPSWKTCPR